ncbi:MAG: hypothetical protein RIF41_26665 [Polyangiaceae bacterium]
MTTEPNPGSETTEQPGAVRLIGDKDHEPPKLANLYLVSGSPGAVELTFYYHASELPLAAGVVARRAPLAGDGETIVEAATVAKVALNLPLAMQLARDVEAYLDRFGVSYMEAVEAALVVEEEESNGD